MSTIKSIIKEKEQKSFQFHPDKHFYDAVKIKQKRWGQIYRGDTSPTIEELKSIANYFEVDVNKLI